MVEALPSRLLSSNGDTAMVNVAPLDESADKFERRGRQAGQDYETGVERVSDSDQQQATVDAADRWESGVQDAISEGRFTQGAQNPNKSWQTAAIETGASRFTSGVSESGDVWEDAFQPFADTLESLSLEPRGPRGDQANYDRSQAVGEALNRQRDSR
jgi:hypothetical protein